jgi:hypothetical protein
MEKIIRKYATIYVDRNNEFFELLKERGVIC